MKDIIYCYDCIDNGIPHLAKYHADHEYYVCEPCWKSRVKNNEDVFIKLNDMELKQIDSRLKELNSRKKPKKMRPV